MNYWIFKFNPDKYRLAERMANPSNSITWTVSRFKNEIEPSDIVFLWETGANRGIRAVLQIDAPPSEMAEWESEQSYWNETDDRICTRVVASFIKRQIYLPHTLLRATPGLEQLSVFHGFQQTSNFRVTLQEGKLIEGLIAS